MMLWQLMFSYLGTQFYTDGKMNSSGSGSFLETAECFRHQALGTEVMLFTSTKDEYDTFIAFGILMDVRTLPLKIRKNNIKMHRI